jgi:hypothetical protein
MEHWWRILAWENPSTRRKPCPISTLTTRKLTWTDLGSTPVLRGERPATDCLSHRTANLKLTVFLRNNKDLICTSQKTNCICVKDHFVLIFFVYISIRRERMKYLQVDGQITNLESGNWVRASACSALSVSTEEMPDNLLTLTEFVHILGHPEVPE